MKTDAKKIRLDEMFRNDIRETIERWEGKYRTYGYHKTAKIVKVGGRRVKKIFGGI